MSLGERLKSARTAAGFKTAGDAAARFGWNKNTYASNENGNAGVSLERAADYAQAFGVSVDWLATGKGREMNSQRAEWLAMDKRLSRSLNRLEERLDAQLATIERLSRLVDSVEVGRAPNPPREGN